ncbi:MAG TPA: hypothetical protein VK745_01310 [Polyangiaceae bacterium]|nr:hypothetical protein [Polyangiaceae bacterium]
MDQLDGQATDKGLSLGTLAARAIGKFLLSFALVFGLFCIPMTVIGPGYVRAFCVLGNAILPEPESAQQLAFRLDPARPSQARPWQAQLDVEDRQAGTRVVMPLETMSLTYIPLITFLALALATPITDRRRELLILVPGFLLTSTITLLLVTLSVTSILNDLSPIRLFNFGPRVMGVLGVLFRALMSPGMTYAVPGLLWWFLVRVTRPPRSTGRPDPRARSATRSRP